MNFTFNVRPIVRAWDDEMIANLSDLINEGIGYWATEESPEVHELPLLFVVTECETLRGNDAPQTHRIELATIALGINRILSYECPVNTASLGRIAVFVSMSDIGVIDSEDVDLIVQAGLYNDIKWG